jgi:Tfp pilus assembly protein PilV
MNSINFNKRIGGKKQLGQGMTEYIIIVALVAIGAIGVYNLFGKTIRDQTSAMACGLAGNQGCSTGQSTNAGTDATNAVGQADATQGLTNFGQNTQNQ